MRVVFCSGCFDLLHVGHARLFAYCRSLGTFLVVSVASDATIHALKRVPVTSELDRLEFVQSIRWVDHAFIARQDVGAFDFAPYLRLLRPDVWVIDPTDPHRERKEAMAEQLGVEIVFNYRPVGGPSSSGLIRLCAERELAPGPQPTRCFRPGCADLDSADAPVEGSSGGS